MWWGKSQCYNINQFASRPPDSTGRLVKDKTRKKISEKMKGRTISENTKLIISQSNKTRQLSEETLKKKSESASGERNSFYGKRHNAETLQEFSEQRKGKKWWYNDITNETSMSRECPGDDWFPGRKPKT